MELTESYRDTFPDALIKRYRLIEVRNAAAILYAVADDALQDLLDILTDFQLTAGHLLDPGGNKSEVAKSLDEALRRKGWRETHLKLTVDGALTRQPWNPPGGRGRRDVAATTTVRFEGQTHKVDNFKGRIAIEVEWNAKDGNLDRDLSAFRALYDAGVIDAAVIITRHHASVKHAANFLAHALGRVNYHPTGRQAVLRFNTSTTTNLERVRWRLARGDAGGCPVLIVALSAETYTPGLPWSPADGAVVTQPDVPALGRDEEAVLEAEALRDIGRGEDPGE